MINDKNKVKHIIVSDKISQVNVNFIKDRLHPDRVSAHKLPFNTNSIILKLYKSPL